jgi:hypothetical protein
MLKGLKNLYNNDTKYIISINKMQNLINHRSNYLKSYFINRGFNNIRYSTTGLQKQRLVINNLQNNKITTYIGNNLFRGFSSSSSPSSTSSSNINTKVSSIEISENDSIVLDNLLRLNLLLKNPGTANADALLNDFKSIHEYGRVIPINYIFESLNIYCQRHDVIRTELLLRLAKENLLISNNNFKSSVLLSSTRSEPKQQAHDKLINFSISKLMKYGSVDEALHLWVRMANSGYITNKISIEKILDSIGSSIPHTSKFEFINKCHSMVQSNLWDQSPKHYCRVLSAFRQHLKYSCNSIDELNDSCDRLTELWSESQYNIVSNPTLKQDVHIELYAIKVQCWLSAMISARKLGLRTEKYRLEATLSFQELVAAGDIGEWKSNNGNPNEDTSSFNNSYSSTSMGDLLDKFVNDIKSFSANKVQENNNTTDSINKNIIESKIPINVRESNHYDLSKPKGQMRSAIIGFLEELVKDDLDDDVINFLNIYINHKNIQKQEEIITNDNKSIDSVVLPNSKFSNKLSKNALIEILANKTGSLPSSRSNLKNKHIKSSKQHEIWTLNDRHWIENLYASLILSKSQFIQDENQLDSAQKRNRISVFSSNLLKSAKSHNIELGAPFYSSWIRSYGLTENLYDSRSKPNDFEDALESAYMVVDALDDSLVKDPLISHAIISMLSSFTQPNAVEKALQIATKFISDKKKILPITWSSLLNSSTACLGNKKLTAIVSEIEELVNRCGYKQQDISITHARLFANARLCKGYQSLTLLQTLRSLGGPVNRKTYIWVATSLYLCWPDDESEWRVVKDPISTSEWLLREMLRDGYKATPNTVAVLLKLFTKNCQISKASGGTGVDLAVAKAEMFVKQCSEGGYMNHMKVTINETIVRELIKACCVAGKEERALWLLENMESLYGVKPTSLSYEPLLYKYAGVDGMLTLAEDVLMLMINRGVTISESIVDSFILGHINKGDSQSALDQIQGLFNQHGARPSVKSLMRLLDISLYGGDEHEARRVVVVIEQLYSLKERTEIISIDKLSSSSTLKLEWTLNREIEKKKKEMKLLSSKFDLEEDEDNDKLDSNTINDDISSSDIVKNKIKDKLVMEEENAEKDLLFASEIKDIRDEFELEMSEDESIDRDDFAYGVLSSESLKARFKLHNLTL